MAMTYKCSCVPNSAVADQEWVDAAAFEMCLTKTHHSMSLSVAPGRLVNVDDVT